MSLLYLDDLSYLEMNGMTDLEELKDYWAEKYPHMTINLWQHQDSGKFHGLMYMDSLNANLCANTIGELISQGEVFLRKMK